jgi:rod shape-determining protein MreD
VKALTARIVVFGIVVGIVQITFVSQFPVAGGTADLAPLAVTSIGLLCGGLAGAAFGFGLGLFLDVSLLQTLGVTSLILVGIGWFAGRLRDGVADTENSLVPVLAGAAATVTMSVAYSVIQFLLDVSAPVSGVLLRQLLATLILNTLLALPLHAIVRRWLRRSLPQEPKRRRRQPSSSPLSPLQQGLRSNQARRLQGRRRTSLS